MHQALVATLAVAAVAVVAPAARAQDAAAGERVFAQCRACHAVPNAQARNMVGPQLHNVVGRRAASIEGFRYSQNMQQLGQNGHTWTEENLRAYLTNPKAVAPQGTMAFPGIRNEQQLNDLIAYLQANSPGS